MMSARFYAFAGLLMIFCTAAIANEGPDLSFSQKDAYQSVDQSIDNLLVWAQGEYTEHELEGLFERYPDDAAVIKAQMDLAKHLKDEAQQAEAAGDLAKARAYLFAAEAAALYAAKMPHLLEDRVAHH